MRKAQGKPRARDAGIEKEKKGLLADEDGKKKQAGRLARCLLQVVRCNTTLLQMCMCGGESRMPATAQQPVDGQGPGGGEGRGRGVVRRKAEPGLPGLWTAEESIVERTGCGLEG